MPELNSNNTLLAKRRKRIESYLKHIEVSMRVELVQTASGTWKIIPSTGQSKVLEMDSVLDILEKGLYEMRRATMNGGPVDNEDVLF